MTRCKGDGFKLGGVFPQHDEMQRPEKGPKQFNRITWLDFEPFDCTQGRPPARREHECPDACQRDSDEIDPMWTFAKADPKQERREHGIKTCEKAGIGNFGEKYSYLLCSCGDTKN